MALGATKTWLLICIYLVFGFSSALTAGNQTELWEQYKKKYKKDYDGQEENVRRELFLAKQNYIELFNSFNNATYKIGHNVLSDQSDHELDQLPGLRDIASTSVVDDIEELRPNAFDESTFRDAPIPDSFDLRNDPCMPAVKKKGNCGSCWSFSALTPLEFSACKKYKNVTVLSEQQLLDCDTAGSNHGCTGGFYTNAWEYLIKAGGSATASSYPYVGYQNRKCSFGSSMIGARVLNYTTLPNNDIKAIKLAIMTYGPVAAAMRVIRNFYSYSSGIYNDPGCHYKPNHAVVIVGWGVSPDTNTSYWIVRNSWGASWGIDGYCYMQLGVDQCSIESNKYRTAYVIPA